MSPVAARPPAAPGLSAFAQRPASTATLPGGRRLIVHRGIPVGSFAVQPRGRGPGTPLPMDEVDAAAAVVIEIERDRDDMKRLPADRQLRDVVRDALNTLLAFEIVALARLAREHDDDRLLKRLREISAGSLRANQVEKAVAAAVAALAGPDAVRDAFTNRAERRATAARDRRTGCT